MGPNCNFHFSPAQQNIGMMSLFLGEFSDFVYKCQRGFEVRELVET
jgi:hypothetical protein